MEQTGNQPKAQFVHGGQMGTRPDALGDSFKGLAKIIEALKVMFSSLARGVQETTEVQEDPQRGFS